MPRTPTRLLHYRRESGAEPLARHVVLDVRSRQDADADTPSDPDEQQQVDPAATYDTADPWQRPVEGGVLPIDAWDRPGRELAEAWLDDELPPPPFSVLTGCTPHELGDGWIEWIAPAPRWWCSPAPYLYGGMLAAFAEATLSGASLTVSPPGQVAATVDLTVRFVRPVFPDGGLLRARAEVVHAGRNLRVARCRVEDAAGKLVLLAESSAVLIPPRLLREGSPAMEDGLLAA